MHGRVDILAGLKENVIMGRLIPAGTGGQLARMAEMEADPPLARPEEPEPEERMDETEPPEKEETG